MERTKLLTFAVLGLLVLNLVMVGFLVLQSTRPRPVPPGGLPGGREPAEVIIDRLHFDPSQQRAYRKRIAQHQQQTRTLNAEVMQLHQRYYGLLATARFDTATAAQLAWQIAGTQRKLAELNFAHFQDIKALCRPDQQADFTRLVDDLARLFGRPQRPPRPEEGSPPDESPENFSTRP